MLFFLWREIYFQCSLYRETFQKRNNDPCPRFFFRSVSSKFSFNKEQGIYTHITVEIDFESSYSWLFHSYYLIIFYWIYAWLKFNILTFEGNVNSSLNKLAFLFTWILLHFNNSKFFITLKPTFEGKEVFKNVLWTTFGVNRCKGALQEDNYFLLDSHNIVNFFGFWFYYIFFWKFWNSREILFWLYLTRDLYEL